MLLFETSSEDHEKESAHTRIKEKKTRGTVKDRHRQVIRSQDSYLLSNDVL